MQALSPRFRVLSTVEHDGSHQLATARLETSNSEGEAVVDLLFASSAIEADVIAAAISLEVFPGVRLPVARTGHLVAMKLLSSDESRPQDTVDLHALLAASSDEEVELASQAVELILERGAHRDRDLREAWTRLLARRGGADRPRTRRGTVSRMVAELSELTEHDLRLIEYARAIVEANADGLVHTVGAAVRDREGRMFGGINLYHFTGGPCAELVALATARAQGAGELEAIVAVGDRSRGVLAPCGRDRQVLADYHPTIRVVLPTEDGLRSAPIAALLPWRTVWTPD